MKKFGRIFRMFLAAACLLAVGIEAYAQAPGLVVATENGQLRGADAGDGIRAYKGIPFAAPPVGELRWKVPQPLQPWEGVREATAFGPSPMQAAPTPFLFWSREFLIPEEPINEDCLYLNVWTPAKASDEKLPVLVYIYGGGFRSGGGGCPIYDGKATAEKGIVFVSINYRVGLFGFLAHPELSAESPAGASGNYGLMDMVAGLQWVKDNIAAFGGDPGRVTIAGQSAGAFAVNYLTVSPLARGLFHGAIAESGGDFMASRGGRGQALSVAEAAGLELETEMGVQGLEALRALPAEKLLTAQKGGQWPIVDGQVITEPVAETYAKGGQAQVPVLLGWNKDDLVFVQQQEPEAFRASLGVRFGEMAASFSEAYPSGNAAETLESQKRLSRDEIFGIQVHAWARAHASKPGQPVYLYNFNRAVPGYDEATRFGAFHSGEIVYAYDNLHTLDRPWEPADRELTRIMSGYWANFVRSGDPNGAGLPNWPGYDREQEQLLQLDTEVKAVSFPDREAYDLWGRFLGGDR